MVYEDVKVARTQGGKVIGEEIEHREVGRIDNRRILTKLKNKGIFSLREDFAQSGDLWIADRIINERAG